MTATLVKGDRPWSEAGEEIVEMLAKDVAKRSKAVDGKGDVDAVHDMRTTTRRLRTAITIYGEEAPDADREPVEEELKRVSRLLGAVRDLDILLKALDASDKQAARNHHDLAPLRRAWRDERKENSERLADELNKPRFRRALDQARSLVRPSDTPTHRIATRAPALIWEHFGQVVAYDIDPDSADPDRIHEVRIAAKKLRYTLEAFQDALEPGASLIVEVTALQDAAGDMHDAIVAGERARSVLDDDHLRRRERSAIDAFADAQHARAEGMRPQIGRSLRTIRSRAFRNGLGRAVAGMGHIER